MSCPPQSDWAVGEDGKIVRIQDYVEGKVYCLQSHHDMVAARGHINKHHFRHLRASDVGPKQLCDWHLEWQSHFKLKEVPFHNPDRRADIVEGQFVVEIQHSSISPEEVSQRNQDYAKHGKQVVWIVDGTDMAVTVKNDDHILTFDNAWKFESFKSMEFVFIDVGGVVYPVYPSHVGSMTVHAKGKDKQVFIESILKGDLMAFEARPPHKLYIKQQGAGNGKTYGIIHMLGQPEFQHYKHFIYVTKQHTARAIIYQEFEAQKEALKFKVLEEPDKNSKKYTIPYSNANGDLRTISIATVDSFMYAVGNKEVKSADYFAGIVSSIVGNHLNIDTRGGIEFAGRPKLNAETLYIVDETQDLSVVYAEAIMVIMKHTNMDVYVVGDKLQSIVTEDNAFTHFRKQTGPTIERLPDENVCRRFTHPVLTQFVNFMIPFKKYELPSVTPYKETADSYVALKTHPLDRTVGEKEEDHKIDEASIDWIIYQMEQEVELNHYGPENFLFVTPWVSSSDASKMVNHVVAKVQEFWVEKMKGDRSKLSTRWQDHDPEEYHPYVVLHRTEQGTSINLNESAEATRFVSIQSSKGDGREVVFLIDPSDFKLTCHHMYEQLGYYSMLHVAITRMKKSLYVLYNSDDTIGKKIVAFRDKNLNSEPYKLSVSPMCPLEIFETDQIFGMHQTCLDEGDYTEIVDMSHHNIRRACMVLTALKCFGKMAKRDSLLWHTCNIVETPRKHDIIPCDTWVEYTKKLKHNTKINKASMDGKQRPRDPQDPERFLELSIPLLRFKTSHYSRTCGHIYDILDRVRERPFYTDGCPLECVVELYAIEAIQRGTRARVTMSEVYDIFHTYSNSFAHHLTGHDKCLCRTLFKNNDDVVPEYLLTHYERIRKLAKLIDELHVDYPKLNWNYYPYIRFHSESKDFSIQNQPLFVGYNDSHVVVLYLVPNLNPLNYPSILIQASIDRFILSRPAPHASKGDVYGGKDIVCVALALNMDAPYRLPTVELPIKVIQEHMYEYFCRRNTAVKQYFDCWTAKLSFGNVCHQYVRDEEKKYEVYTKKIDGKEREMKRLRAGETANAPYITSFFKFLKDTYDNHDDPEAYVQEVTLNFGTKLNRWLRKSLDNFFE